MLIPGISKGWWKVALKRRMLSVRRGGTPRRMNIFRGRFGQLIKEVQDGPFACDHWQSKKFGVEIGISNSLIRGIVVPPY